MKNKKTFPERLTLSEASYILLHSDMQTIQNYVKNGTIPAVTYDFTTETIDTEMLAKLLGVTDFREPFIDQATAKKLLKLTKATPVFKYCKQHGINMYRLSNKKGCRYLFRKSDIENHLKLTLEFYPFGHAETARKNQEKLVIDFLTAVLATVDQGTHSDVLTCYLQGRSLQEIGLEFAFTNEWTRQHLKLIREKMTERITRVTTWVQVFGKTQYAAMNPEDVLKILNLMLTENESLKKELRKYQGESSRPAISQAEQLAHNIQINDLDFSKKVLNGLRRFDPSIKTLGDLVQCTPSQIYGIPWFGKKAFTDIVSILQKHGLKLAEETSRRYKI